MRHISIAILSIFLICNSLFSQENPPPVNARDDRGWASVGAGYASDFDFSMVATLNWEEKKLFNCIIMR